MREREREHRESKSFAGYERVVVAGNQARKRGGGGEESSVSRGILPSRRRLFFFISFLSFFLTLVLICWLGIVSSTDNIPESNHCDVADR